MGQHQKWTLKQSLSHVYDLSFSYISAIFLPFFFFPHLVKLLRSVVKNGEHVLSQRFPVTHLQCVLTV